MRNKEEMFEDFYVIKQEAVRRCGEDLINKLLSSVADIYEHDVQCIQGELDEAYTLMIDLYNLTLDLELENRTLKESSCDELYILGLI
ncbi:MAG: hypothetical protein ACRC0G_07655 [Fusobacteriaceae bacterium]